VTPGFDRSSTRSRWARGGFALTVAAASALLWVLCGTSPIEDWREADTQTIALYFTEPGSTILKPRIAWGGAGPGYVEAEFQLYTWLVSLVLRLVGDAEWPGRALSLVATMGAAALAFKGLARLHGNAPAALGAVTMLSSRGVLSMATTVQPEALCLLFYTGAWFSWLAFEETKSNRALGAYVALGALAMLVKPTAAQLGISSFLLLVFRSRVLLRRPAIWVAWLAMLLPLALHLWYARGIYLEYGNTFGVLSGGDSKLPHLEQLFTPRLHHQAATKVVGWGTGVLGALCIVGALALRPGRPLLVALLASHAVWTVFTLRYAVDNGGNHYHLLASVTAGHAVAQLGEAAIGSRRQGALLAGMASLCLAGLAHGIYDRFRARHNPWNEPAMVAGAALLRVSRPGDLVVVRSVENAYDRIWRTPNNFEDPRVFYLSRTRGWPVGLDDTDPARVSARAAQGARFYVETIPRPASAKLDAWLEAHADLLATTPFGGKVFALPSSP
jgi:hypothetical protein